MTESVGKPPYAIPLDQDIGHRTYPFFTFQNTIVGPFNIPVRFDRHADD